MRPIHGIVAAALTCALTGPARAGIAFDAGARTEVTSAEAAGGRIAAVALTPRVSWGPWRRPDLPVFRYAPTFSLEHGARSSSRTVHRATMDAEPGRRAGMRPFLRAAGEIGTSRRSDEAGTSSGHPAGVARLRSYTVGATGGLVGGRSRRHSLRLGLSAERSSGFGGDAEVLPSLTRLRGTFQNENRLSRNEAVETTGELAYGLRGAGDTEFTAGLNAGARRRLGARIGASLDAGAAATRRHASGSATATVAFSLAGGASVQYAAAVRRGLAGADCTLRLRPEFDRLDGALRQRLDGRCGLVWVLGDAASLRPAVQWTSDLSGAGPLRRRTAVDAVLHLDSGQNFGVDLGARHLIERGAPGPARSLQSESRVFISLTTRSRGR